MHRLLLRLYLCFLCSMPGLATAATTAAIHVAWSPYTPPSQLAVSGFRLHREGVPVCRTTNARATAMDCTVSIVAETTSFTLTATFANGTESPHSAPFFFKLDADEDGILDSWEMSFFGNTTTADATSDADRDGYTDLQEFRNAQNGETDPQGARYDPKRVNAPGGTGHPSRILPILQLLLSD
ncbi:MAG: hypothetical protein RBS95_11640 [Desulfobulbus sp.]|jgi:hypothetical protein|nr:hypothetical protein [Desulfobulbus sp.]